MPEPEELALELAKATSITDSFGEVSKFTRLFSKTIEPMLGIPLTENLGYERCKAGEGNSGNSPNRRYYRNFINVGRNYEYITSS